MVFVAVETGQVVLVLLVLLEEVPVGNK